MRHHITPVIKPIVIKRTRKNKCQKGYGEKGTLVHCCGNVNSCSHYGRQYGSSKKLKLQLPYDPVIPLPGIDPKEMKTESKRDSYTPIYCSIIYNSLDMETACMFINGRVGKEDGSTCVHIYIWNIIIPAMREGNLAFVTPWIDLEGVIPKPDRERQVLHDITYIWNLNKKKKNTSN